MVCVRARHGVPVHKHNNYMNSMIQSSTTHPITTIEQLEALYDAPAPASLIKEIDHISEHYRVFIEKSPFVLVASSGPGGLDCTPRGDPPGFVRVVDERTVMMPDRSGNNRLDTLRNLVHDPRIALLFLVPGVGETLRINGRAEIVADPELCESFALKGQAARSVIVVHADTVYFQCPKALVRSKVWRAEAQVERSELPSTGAMLEALSCDGMDGQAFDQKLDAYLQKEFG